MIHKSKALSADSRPERRRFQSVSDDVVTINLERLRAVKVHTENRFI